MFCSAEKENSCGFLLPSKTFSEQVCPRRAQLDQPLFLDHYVIILFLEEMNWERGMNAFLVMKLKKNKTVYSIDDLIY